MSRHRKFSWMVKPKGFISLLGGEYSLMQRAGGSVLLKFYLSSLIVLLIAAISFISVAYAIELLFHVLLVEILLSAFLTSLFVLLFIFIVNTFTKDASQRKLFSLSNITRLGFVMFIGFIISKPVEVFLFRKNISADVHQHKTALAVEHHRKIDQLFAQDIAKLKSEKEKYKALGFSLSQIDQQLDLIDNKKNDLLTVSSLRIEQGAYFIYRIKIVSWKYPASWLITLGMVILFLMPVWLIYSISSDEEYFKLKHAEEKRMVEGDYATFRQKYAEIFLRKFGLQVQFYSKYENPPFNTVLKKRPPISNAEEFHKHYAQT